MAANRPSRDEVRAALLDAAYDEFAERGYHAASVESIAARAGFTKGAVYGNFDGKFGLFLGLMGPDRMNRESLVLGAGGEPGDPEASLARIARRLHRTSQDFLPSLMVVEARGEAARSPDLAARFAESRTAVVDHMTPLFAQELARVGLRAVIPVREVVYATLGLVTGIALEQVGVGEPVVAPEVFERFLGTMVAPVDASVDTPASASVNGAR